MREALLAEAFSGRGGRGTGFDLRRLGLVFMCGPVLDLEAWEAELDGSVAHQAQRGKRRNRARSSGPQPEGGSQHLQRSQRLADGGADATVGHHGDGAPESATATGQATQEAKRVVQTVLGLGVGPVAPLGAGPYLVVAGDRRSAGVGDGHEVDDVEGSGAGMRWRKGHTLSTGGPNLAVGKENSENISPPP